MAAQALALAFKECAAVRSVARDRSFARALRTRTAESPSLSEHETNREHPAESQSEGPHSSRFLAQPEDEQRIPGIHRDVLFACHRISDGIHDQGATQHGFPEE